MLLGNMTVRAARPSSVLARCSGLARVAGRSCARAPQAGCTKPAQRRLLSTAAAEAAPAAAEAEATGLRWLLKEGQVDSGFYQGSGMLGLVIGAVMLSTDDHKKYVVETLIEGYRTCGLQAQYIGDKVLVEDFVRKNASAAVNVLMASPVFYFSFAAIYREPLSVCLLRGLTGTMRIVPFMFSFYGAFALICPFVTQALMARGQTYEAASSNAMIGVLLSGFVMLEALVELRGCGVTFQQMNAVSFLLFVPALIGRLATGVMLQQSKVGAEAAAPFLPASWNDADAPTWQQHTYMLFDRLSLDKDFVITCVGTSVFQHVLNSITWCLLTRGRSVSLWEMTKFMFGGIEGTVLSGASQFGKTFLMRVGFSWAWNFSTSQQLPMPVFDAFLATAKS